MEKQLEIAPENLKMQIEGFSNFDKVLTPGAGAKKVMSEMLKASSSDLWKVKPSDITVMPGYNPRTQNRAYFEGVQELAEKMVKHGYYQDKPLSVFIAKVEGEDRLVLQDGHRRHAAVLRAIEMGAPIKVVPVVQKQVAQKGAEVQVELTLALLHSNEGEPFSTYEKAILAKRLKTAGWENKEIATEFRCTTAFVGQLLTMANAPQAIAELVQNGNLSATEAHRLMLEHGAEEAERIATDGMAKAAEAGRTRITAKDLTPGERKERNAKKFGPQLYKAVLKMLRNEKVLKAMTNEEHEAVDSILSEIEKAPKKKAEPKPKKEPKAAAKKAPKVPVAKKIATVAAKKAAKPATGAAFYEQLAQQEAERKAAKASAKATAKASAVGQRRSDR